MRQVQAEVGRIRRGVGVALLAVALTGAVERPSLITAARNADRETLRALIQQGANINAVDEDRATALHWAAYRDDRESAELLIRAGANVNAANDLGVTPLWLASQNKNAELVRV